MITYNSENVRFPNIKRRETTAWIRRVAATYGKKVGATYSATTSTSSLSTANTCSTTTIRTLSPSTTAKAMCSMATSLSHWIPCAPMPNSSIKTTMKSSTASSSTAFSTSAARTTRGLASASRWRQQRTVHLLYAKSAYNFYFYVS